MKTEAINNKEKIVFGNDSVVIRKYISGIHGGRTLDCTGVAEENILAGHVIIKKSNGDYAPMPVANKAYGTLPEGAKYAGILSASISVKSPSASIMIDGIVNETVIPYSMTGIMDAFKTACPHIIFEQDEEA